MMNTVVKLIEDKVCTKCKQSKSLSEFMHSKRDGVHSHCNECRNFMAREKYKSNPPVRDKEARRIANKKHLDTDPEKHAKLLANKKKYNSSVGYYDNYFMKKFGVTYDYVKNMFDSQLGRCANRGCGKEIVFYHENEHGRAHPNRACLDRDHQTGKVRALLCMPCNTILGTLETKENIVLGLLEYGYKFSPTKNSLLFNLTEKME